MKRYNLGNTLSAWCRLLVAGLAAGLAACTGPEVVTQVNMSYPPSVDADGVVVYEPGDSVPADAMRLGWVAVGDNGMSHRCHYDQVLRLAREKTAETGGNALRVVQHETPSFWRGSCHQIRGEMLLTGKIDIDSIDFDAFAKAALREEEEARLRERRALPPGNAVKLSAGAAWNDSKVVTEERTCRGGVGSDVMLTYQHLFKRGHGFGLSYICNHGDYRHLGALSLHYVGASWVMAARLGEHYNWRGDLYMGLGFAHYSVAGWEHGNGPGAHMGIGLEYMLAKHVGVGAELSYLGATFKRPAGVVKTDDREYGHSRLSLQGGLRFYF